ncbi:beta-lactamase domain-containing protein [Sarocladium implicatum]|nr:beta-lactamase domain-containing protein [Sarocladium implicatum]
MSFQALEKIIIANSGSTTAAAALGELGTPSTSIAVLKDGDVSSVCHSTSGNNESTLFQACSISKPITALAIMRLVERGALSLESSISQLLPTKVLDILLEGSPDSQRSIIKNITVAQLMSHTAGLSVHGFGGYSSLSKPLSGADILRGRAPVNNLRVRLELLPGLSYSYSGGGITVLQIILETVTGKPFPELMQDLVLQPLDMNRSFYGPLPDGEDNFASAHHTGNVRADVAYHLQPELAAAGLWTTPTDLLKAIKAVQQSLAADGFLKKATVKDMLTKRKSTMGLSWFVSHDDIDFSHSGSNEPGYRCIVSGFAKLGQLPVPEDCGFAVMTNSAQGVAVMQKVGQALCYLHDWPMGAVTGAKIQDTPFWDEEAHLGDTWKSYVGDWQGDGHSFQFVDESGNPVLYYDGVGPMRLLSAATPGARSPAGEVIFFVLEGHKLLLKLGYEGEEKSMTLENGEQKTAIELKRAVES